MASTYSRVLLSGSTSGDPIPVVATATPGTLIHTAIAGAGSFDEMYVAVSNVTNAAEVLTIEWGSASDPGGHLVHVYNVPANSAPIWIATGQTVNGGVEIRAFAGNANRLNITGKVNRIQ